MKRIRFLSMLAFLFLGTVVYGQNDKFKAIFVYNFVNYIDWPGGITGSFVITVIGDSPILGELTEIAKIRKINNVTPIEVKKVATVAEVGKTHILFVPSGKKKMLPEISQSLSGKPVLIISDNSASDFGINFVEVDGKQSFQISKSNIEAHKLKVNSTLFNLGISVN
jgi:hypothetical protein